LNDKIIQIINTMPINAFELRKELSTMNIVDIGELFDNLSKEKTIQLFRLLPKGIAANVFAYIETDKQKIIVEALTDNEVGNIIGGLFADDAVDFIEEMPANVVSRVLRSVNAEKRAIINRLLQYPDGSVGGMMTTEYMTLREDHNLLEAIEEIRKKKMKGLHTCYVIRRDKLLVGTVSLKMLLLAKEHERIGDIMHPNVISAETHDDQEKAAILFRKYDLLSLPIVDKEGRMVGIITVDDAVEIVEEETTEDFEKMAAILPSEDPYLKTGAFKHAYRRVGWLLILMIAAIFTEMIIYDMEELLATLPALFVFVPMLMDMGGNVGSQTSTLIIRSMALDEIAFKDILKIWWREIRIAVLCGIVLSLVNAARVIIFNTGDVWLTITVTLTLLTVVVISKSLGCLLPMAAKKIKLDPAILATPIIKTIADVIALVMYFAIASVLIPELR